VSKILMAVVSSSSSSAAASSAIAGLGFDDAADFCRWAAGAVPGGKAAAAEEEAARLRGLAAGIGAVKGWAGEGE
jgi:hypothetical protein